jgi:hypothetical protein
MTKSFPRDLPKIDPNGLCNTCLDTLSAAHKHGLLETFCQSCGATMHVGPNGRWQLKHRSPFSRSQTPRTSELL